MFFSHIDVSLPISLPSFPSLKSISMSSCEDKKNLEFICIATPVAAWAFRIPNDDLILSIEEFDPHCAKSRWNSVTCSFSPLLLCTVVQLHGTVPQQRRPNSKSTQTFLPEKQGKVVQEARGCREIPTDKRELEKRIYFCVWTYVSNGLTPQVAQVLKMPREVQQKL